MISDAYLSDMVVYPDLDVRFVADVFTDRAAAQAAKHGVAASGSVAEALEREDVDLVVNLTIPAAHAEVAHQALDAGKHVWNEKPLATSRSTRRRWSSGPTNSACAWAGPRTPCSGRASRPPGAGSSAVTSAVRSPRPW